MLVGRKRHSSNAAPLKAEYLVHMHPQLPHISLVGMVTQPPYTLLQGGATGKGAALSPSGIDRSTWA